MVNGIVRLFTLIIVATDGFTEAVSNLEIIPPRLVVRYGDPFSVNCSTSIVDNEGMTWEESRPGSVKNVRWVTWTAKSFKNWDEGPRCYVHRKKGLYFSKALEVILYKLPNVVSISPLSHTGPMVEGREYELQCDVINVAPVRNLRVIFYKGNETIRSYSVIDHRKTPVDESSVLTITPSREDDGALYRCEAQLNLGPEGPHPFPVMTSLPLRISVQHPPVFLSPSSQTFELRKGDEVTLNCTATGNPAPVYSWQTSPPQENMGDEPLLTSSSLLPGTYNCTASNHLGEQTKVFILKDKDGFTEAVSNLEIDPPRLVVRFGDPVSVNCSTSVADVEGMGWEASQGATGLVENVTSVMWTVESFQDWDGSPKCFMNLKNGEQYTKALEVTLYKLPEDVLVFLHHDFYPMVEGREYQLQCFANNVAPVQNVSVIWYKGNETIETDSSSGQIESEFEYSSLLTIIPSREDDGALYRCEAQLNLGPEGPHPFPVMTSLPHSISVQHPPVFLSPSSQTFELRNGDEVTLNCTATGNPAPVYSWQTSPPQENMGDEPLLTSSSLLPGTYNCTASNHLGEQTKVFVLKDKDGFTQAVSNLEINPPRLVVRFGDPVSVNCSTSIADIEGMGWEASQGATGLVENVTSVMWTVESFQDWDGSPKCFMNLKNGEQYTKALEVTLYKLPNVVSISPLNHTGPMVEGREYQLQCDVINVAPVQNVTMIWYKGNETIKTDSSSGQIESEFEYSSILTIAPSREDDGALYRCEAQLNLGPEGPHPFPVMTSLPHSISVQHPPVFLSPSSQTFELRNRDEVTLNCTATGNPAPVYSWQTSPPQENMGDEPLLTSSSLLPGTYNCTASNHLGEQTKVFVLKHKVDRTTFWAIIGSFLGLALVITIIYAIFKMKVGSDSII